MEEYRKIIIRRLVNRRGTRIALVIEPTDTTDTRPIDDYQLLDLVKQWYDHYEPLLDVKGETVQ